MNDIIKFWIHLFWASSFTRISLQETYFFLLDCTLQACIIVLIEEIWLLFPQNHVTCLAYKNMALFYLFPRKSVLFITQGKCLMVFMKEIWWCVVYHAIYGMIHFGKKNRFALIWWKNMSKHFLYFNGHTDMTAEFVFLRLSTSRRAKM